MASLDPRAKYYTQGYDKAGYEMIYRSEGGLLYVIVLALNDTYMYMYEHHKYIYRKTVRHFTDFHLSEKKAKV